MGSLRIGGEIPTALYLDGQAIQAVYYEGELVWPDGTRVSVPVSSVTWSDFAPAVQTGVNVAIPSDATVWEDFDPDVFIDDQSAVQTDVVWWEDFAPEIAAGAHVMAPLDAMDWADFAPSVSISVVVRPPADEVEWTDYAPAVMSGATIDLPLDDTAWADYAPTILTGVNVAVPTSLADWRDFAVSLGYAFSTGFSTGFNAPPTGGEVVVPADAGAWTDYAPTITAINKATREFRAVTLSLAAAVGNSKAIEDCDVGAAATGRHVFAYLFLNYTAGSSRTISSVTIGGETARVNVLAQYEYAPGTFLLVALVSAQLDTGTTADINVTMSGSFTSMAARAATYRVMGLLSNVETDVDSRVDNSYGNNRTLAVDVETNGLLFDAFYVLGQSAGGDYSYSGITKNFETQVSTSEFELVGGSLEVTADELARIITFTGSVNNRGPRIAAAFR